MPHFYPHPIIAREGWPFIVIGLLLSLLFSCWAEWWSLPFWLFTLFALQFFRDPARPIPQEADAILTPADGRIVVVEKALDPYRGVEALKISVFMNVFNVHSQRSPVDGTVTRMEYNGGKFLNAALDKASTENERNAVLVTTYSGREITFVQVAGLVARRILCYTHEGDRLRRGERYGFIRFGSRVDVYLPVDAVAAVAIGDKVSASSTILARLPLEAPSDVVAPVSAAPVQAGNSVAATAAVVSAHAIAGKEAAGQPEEDEQAMIATAANNVQQAAKTATMPATQSATADQQLEDEKTLVAEAAEQVNRAVAKEFGED